MMTVAGTQAQARRKDKARRPLSYWLKPVLALLTLAGSIGGLALMLDWMKDPRHWPVRRVHVEGHFVHLQPGRLKDAVMPLAEHGFFAAQVGEIQERLQRMPWVEQASVRRVWPDQLRVEVREQRAVAHWGERGLLNPRAEVFEPEEAVDLPQLPHFQGPDGHQQRVLDMYQKMIGKVEPLQLGIDSVRLDARRTWHVQLSNGVTVEVGRNTPVARVARFVRVYPAILASEEGRVVSVDLRYSNGFAVRWQPLNDEGNSTG
jgi:cell division protein FtsQ